MTGSRPLDLVVLVPGNDERETLDALLSRRRASLRIRPLRYEILKHPRRDPGCFNEAAAVLQSFQARAERALVVLDHEGSGQEHRAAGDVAGDLLGRLGTSGWGERVDVVVIEPELETWVWSDSPEIAGALGWHGHRPALRPWLEDTGLWPRTYPKPPRPKESLLAALREVRMRRSAAIYRRLAEAVSLERCEDRAFAQLRTILHGRFPADPHQ